MQPNSPYQPPEQPSPYASNYLDQIAAPAPVKTLNPFVLWALIAGAIVLVVAVFLGINAASGGPSSSSVGSVGATLASLKVAADDAQKTIQSSELRTLNSSLALSLTNTNRDLEPVLEAQDIDVKDKKNASVAAVLTTFESLDRRLEDARLNGVYDRTYAREMTFTLKTLRSDMSVLYKSSRSNSLRSTLEKTDKNLAPLVEEFETFNAS